MGQKSTGVSARRSGQVKLQLELQGRGDVKRNVEPRLAVSPRYVSLDWGSGWGNAHVTMTYVPKRYC